MRKLSLWEIDCPVHTESDRWALKSLPVTCNRVSPTALILPSLSLRYKLRSFVSYLYALIIAIL